MQAKTVSGPKPSSEFSGTRDGKLSIICLCEFETARAERARQSARGFSRFAQSPMRGESARLPVCRKRRSANHLPLITKVPEYVEISIERGSETGTVRSCSCRRAGSRPAFSTACLRAPSAFSESRFAALAPRCANVSAWCSRGALPACRS